MRDSGRSVDNRILIVHDDSSVAHDLEERLAGFGYAVVGTPPSAADLSPLVDRTRPDVVLLQLIPGSAESPGEIGRRWSLPVILLTGTGDQTALRQAGVTGPFGYVVEPFADRELRMNIEMALGGEARRAQADELEDRFFAVSIDMLCCLGFNGFFKRLNPAWERTLGFTRPELMSKPFIEFVHPDDRERTLSQNRTVRSGAHANVFENRYLCQDGSYKWLRWNAAADPADGVIYSVARDVTERKAAEEERERMVSEIRAALAEVRTLQEILPICSYCKKIRDDENYWQSVEDYISHHTETTFSHGICPTCYEKEVAPQFQDIRRD